MRLGLFVPLMAPLATPEFVAVLGREAEAHGFASLPKPVQRPHPPIHFGGESDAALARVAALGQGWYGFDLDPPGFAERMRALAANLAAHGRARSEVTVSVSPYLRTTSEADLAAYAAAGADQVILTAFARDADGLRRRLAELAATLLPVAQRL